MSDEIVQSKGIFQLAEHGTNVRTEVVAGVTTFLTMSYIVFLQPAILSGSYFQSDTGMDFGAVMVATCVAAALATAIMALYARYPIAQAPGMGENFFFVLSAIPAAAALAAVKQGQTAAWQVALGVVFVSGVLFLILSLLGVREAIIDAVSPSMKNAMAAGIGLFIAFLGLQVGGRGDGLIVDDPGKLVALNTNLATPRLGVFFFGLILTGVLRALRVRGSILLGILGSTLLCIGLTLLGHGDSLAGFQMAPRAVARVPWITPTLFKMDILAAFSVTMIPYVIIFLFMDVFDTIGTLVGVSEQAGLIKDNKLPRANRALVSDAVGTVAGACLGTSTVTSYIESAAGVEHGGRTGLTGLVVALLFVLALFFSPIVKMVGSYAAITAPALVIVGAMMMTNVKKIAWQDASEAIPAFLTLVGIPLCSSIADGLALGFVSYPVIKLLSGRHKEVGWVMYLLAAVLIVYFVCKPMMLGG